ncbi:hypothetical protein ACN47E_005804 [Coniothyrium glycines]
MAATFAPYQDTPESSRALSPPPLPPLTQSRTSLLLPSPRAYDQTASDQTDSFQASPPASPPLPHSPSHLPPPWRLPLPSAATHTPPPTTTFPALRLAHSAALAYVLPPVSSILLLCYERESEYVRFHAWQASLLFSFLAVVHVIFSWSSVVGWGLVGGEVGAVAWLVRKAWVGAETLERYQVPFFGPLASSLLDDE